MREECEAKVNQYVQELVDNNTELQKRYDAIKQANSKWGFQIIIIIPS